MEFFSATVFDDKFQSRDTRFGAHWADGTRVAEPERCTAERAITFSGFRPLRASLVNIGSKLNEKTLVGNFGVGRDCKIAVCCWSGKKTLKGGGSGKRHQGKKEWRSHFHGDCKRM